MYFEPYTEFRSFASKISLMAPDGNQVLIEIGPGSSFGAEHTTTKLCLRGIEEIFKIKKVKTVLDLGCGSGILGVSAKALGAENVFLIDIDPLAVEEAKRNALRNGVDSNFHIICGSLEDIQRKFDLVIANIVTDELLRMREALRSMLHEGGMLLVSGISESKKERAFKGFTDIGFSLMREFVGGGWVAMLLSI
jgi:ribosomal protein L11 methyltransferase